jgi:hypothetical protein
MIPPMGYHNVCDMPSNQTKDSSQCVRYAIKPNQGFFTMCATCHQTKSMPHDPKKTPTMQVNARREGIKPSQCRTIKNNTVATLQGNNSP